MFFSLIHHSMSLPPVLARSLAHVRGLLGNRRTRYVLLLTVLLIVIVNVFVPSGISDLALTGSGKENIGENVPDKGAISLDAEGVAESISSEGSDTASNVHSPVENPELLEEAQKPVYIDPDLEWALSTAQTEDDTKKINYIYRRDYNDPLGERLKATRAYYTKLFNVLRDADPKTDKVERVDDRKVENTGAAEIGGAPSPTKEYLQSFISLSSDQMSKLTASHKHAVENLPDDYSKGMYEGTGIVYVGGGAFNWYALLSIKNLRKIGCTLPIEVVIPNLEEYELELCERVFPAYGAHCLFLPKVLGKDISSEFKFKGYQYKGLALLVSSFEDVLLLDADNVPVISPEPMFKAEPYRSTGLVIWPDFWKRTTSPYFYDIAGIHIDESKRRDYGYRTYGKFAKETVPEGKVLFHQLEGTIPDPSSESGQLMVSRKRHTRDIMLSLYYNMYGPDYYYPLFSQGAAGEGDKETFITGAHVLGRPYYQVKKLVGPIGMFRNGDFHGVAMKQVNPHDDYELSVEYAESTEEVTKEPGLMFMHINFPKLDPVNLKNEQITIDKATGERNRMFGEDFIDQAHYDFELVQYRSMKIFACDLGIDFGFFIKKGISKEELCEEINAQLDYLKKTTHIPTQQV